MPHNKGGGGSKARNDIYDAEPSDGWPGNFKRMGLSIEDELILAFVIDLEEVVLQAGQLMRFPSGKNVW